MSARGITLVETLVGLLVTAVISMAVFTFTMFYYNSVNKWNSQNSSVIASNAVFQGVGNSIKNAQPCFLTTGVYGSVLDSASSTSVTYYGENCQRYQVFSSSGAVYKKDISLNKQYTIANDLKSLSFTYHLSGSDVAYTSLSTAQLKSVKEIELVLTNLDNKVFRVKYRMRNSPQ